MTLREHRHDPDGQGVKWEERKLSQAERITKLEDELALLRKEVHAGTEILQKLLDAWNSAKFVVLVIKWLGAIGAAIVGIKAGFNALRPGP